MGVVEQQVAQPHKQGARALKDRPRDGAHLLRHKHAGHIVQQQGQAVGDEHQRDAPARLGVSNLHKYTWPISPLLPQFTHLLRGAPGLYT